MVSLRPSRRDTMAGEFRRPLSGTEGRLYLKGIEIKIWILFLPDRNVMEKYSRKGC